MLRRIAPLAMAFAIILTLVPWQATTAAAASTVYVSEDVVNVRAAPSTAARVVSRVYAGDSVIVTGTVSGQAVNGNSTWYRTKSGYYVSAATVSSSPADGPAVAGGNRAGRWVDVNLSTLTARAMQGNTVVFSSPVVSGKPGWETPTGTFRVLSRTPMTTMRSGRGWSEQYVQPNVPYVQYFTPYGHALHGNDYVPASYFGRVRSSHGCVGIPLPAAKYFYDFGFVGMPVVIHY